MKSSTGKVWIVKRMTCFVMVAIGVLSGTAFAADKELKLVTAEIAPYTFVKDGKQGGAVLEVIAEMAKVLKRKPDFEFFPWKRALELAKDANPDGNVYGIVPLARTAEREPHYKWIANILQDDVLLITKKKKVEASKLETALNLDIGVLAGSPGEKILREKGFKRLHTVNEYAASAKALEEGSIDAWCGGRMSAINTWAQLGYDPKALQFGLIVHVQDLYLGASTSISDDEVKKWTKAFETVKAKGIYKKIVSKYK
jgi:polar amino acid transport system substrate-binding protein